MDNSWMNKCTSSWSSVPSSSTSQNQNQQQGVKNQMKISGSSFIHPYGTQGVGSQDNGVVGVPMIFNSLNSGSCRSNKPELGNSFLSLLSGPSSQVQHRIQPMPSSTTHMDCSSLPIQNNNRVFSSDNYGTSPAPVELLSLRSGNCNRKTGPEYCLVEPSCAASTGIHQMGNITSNSEANREGLRAAVGCNEMGTDLLYPRQGWLSNFYLANDQNNTRNIRTSQKMPPVTVSTASGSAPTSKKGSLRVFCLATNGDLLLNNKGLLGVVCLCHGLQMSISKFCEHSGSCIVNPGDAVRLESGETVSHWRRHCFPKYGIRVPDDNSGWDWPEKTPATVGLVNHKPTAPNISKNSDMFKVDPFITSPKTAERWNSFVSPNNSHRGDCVAGNTSGDVMHDLRQNNVQEGCIFSLKSLDETAQFHLPAPLDTQAVHMIKGGARSRGLEKAREGSGYHSVADYIGFLTKSSDPLIANQSLGNFTFLGTCSDVNRCHGSMEASTAERDSTPSNIELRLGQPSQQSYNLEGSVISAMHPQPFVAHSDSQKSLLHDRRFHNAVIPEVTEEPRQRLRHVHSNTSNSPRTENKLSFRQFASMDPAKVEQFKGDMAKSSHMLFSHPSAASERDVMHRARNNMINYGEAFTSSGFPGEYHVTNGSSNIPRNKHYGTQTQLNNNILRHLNHIDKGKIGHHIADNCIYDTEKGNSLFDHMASSSHFMGVFSNNQLPSGTTMNGRQSSYWCRSPGALVDTTFIDNQSNPHGKASFLQGSNCFDQVTPGAVNPSTLSSGPNLSLPKVSTGFSSTNPICRPSLMQLLSNKESDVTPHFLDENLGLLALRHTFDLSKQNHEIVTHKMEQEHERVYDPLTVQMQQRVSTLGSEVSAEQKEGPNCTFTKNTPVFVPKPLQSRPNDYVNDEHLPGATGAKTWCNFSTSSHGIPFHSKEHDIFHPPSLSSRKDKQVLPCLGSIENNSMTREHDVCSRREPSALFTENSSCAVHSYSVARNHVSIGEAPSGPNEEHAGRIIGNMLKLVPSKVDDDHMVQVAKTRNQSENLNRQIHLRNGCHASQWKDVPSKHVVVGNATHLEKSTGVYGVSNGEAQIVMNSGKRFEGRTQVAESLNEQQMSTVYSACSAPAITEITFEANTTDSCTVDAENDRYVNKDVVDEGSGIERCWSSDDAFDSERSTKTNEFHKFNSTKGGKCSTYLPSPTSRDSADNLRLRSTFGLKKVHRLPDGCSVNESINKKQHLQSNLKTGKRKKTVKWKRLDVSFPAAALSSVHHVSIKRIEDTDSYSCSSRGTQVPFKPSAKRKHSSLMSAKTLSRKRDLCELSDNLREWEGDGRKHMKEDMNPQKLSKSSSEKKLKQCCAPTMKKQFSGQELNQRGVGKAAKYCSMTCSKGFLRNQINTFAKKGKPVVCGRYGVISNGELGEDQLNPAKIVSLSTILKTARRCSTPKIEEPGIILNVDTKKTCFISSEDEGKGNEGCGDVMKNKAVVGNCMFNTKKSCLKEDEVYVELLISEKEENDTNRRMFKYGTICSGAPLKSRFKEAHKRTLSELAAKGEDLEAREYLPRSTFKSNGKSCLKKIDSGRNCHRGELSQGFGKKEQKGQPFVLDLDAFCSVCGSSRKDADNCLLECSSCLIRVHQACYGVSRVPKDSWCCRPCRANSKDNVCVLCGYKGGAMTQALKSRNIVKGLLEAWSIASESMSKKFTPLSETSKEELRLSGISGSGYEVDSKSVTRTAIEQSPTALLTEDSSDEMDGIRISNDIPSILFEARTGKEQSPAALLTGESPDIDSLQSLTYISSNLHVHNSVTAGVADSSVKQWVHMVCGLWTPGTRCPNVHTMSAFDISGVSCPPKNVVCSMCNRPGGSYIKCRVLNCSVHFHPWCAHQKSLLQSEVEGADNDMVGFYGRCVLHATHHGSDSVVHPNGDLDTLTREDFTCARAEGYKGRQKDGFRHNFHGGANVTGECLVPKEQIDAWLHINAQKPYRRGLLKPQLSDIEHDSRKEYARYKQAKGWKNLVVYKSGIHGLGLYTSQFISRGAMVVEYVGEIVGLRVADKREIEYQSGRKLQYKSACYFFRIDKECIIDATRKGGIARFVNHSCLPNCVAKIISARNEKKVVFFAERDIYPGEEVTYDYHFNHEDEGEKIPCFCNSKNCRRYLN